MSKASKIAKIIGWIVAGAIMLVVLLLLIIQLPPVKKQIVKVAQNQVNKIFIAELSAEKLSGNIITGLSLHDVLLRSEAKDTIAFIPRLQLSYSLLPLLQGQIQVNELIINEPYVVLQQLSDSTWNVQHIVKPSEDQDTTSGTFNMLVRLNHLQLNNGKVRIETPNKQIPKLIQNLNLDAGGSYSTKAQSLDLKNISFIAEQPHIELRNLQLQAEADTSIVKLANLTIQTAQNSISAQGEYAFNSNEKSQITLQSAPLILDEFSYYLPDNFHLQAKPEIKLDGQLLDQQLALNLLLKDKEQGLDLQLLSYHLIEYFTDTTTIVTYDLALNVDEVDLKYWLNNPNLNYVIDGKLMAKGQGFDPATMQSNVTGNFDDLVLYNNKIDKLTLLLNYNAGNVNGEIDGKGDFGMLYLKPDVRQILSKNPHYTVGLNTRNLNLGGILGETYRSDINLNASVTGSGFELDKINAASKLNAMPSHIMGITIDTISSEIDLVRQNVVIHSFFVKALSTQLQAQGNYDLQGESDLAVKAEVASVDEIMKFVGFEGLQTSGNINAHLHGTPQNLNADVVLGLGNTRYMETASLDSLSVTATGQLTGKDMHVAGKAKADNFLAAGILLDSLVLDVDTDTKNYDLALDAGGKDVQAKLHTLVELGDDIQIVLSDLWLGYKGYNWENSVDTTYIRIADNDYEISSLNLTAPGIDTLRSITAGGIISREGEQDFMLAVRRLEIPELLQVFGVEQNVTGNANLNVRLGGIASAPVLQGDVNVDKFSVENYKINTFTGDVSFNDKRFAVNFDMIPQDSGTVHLTGHVPMNIRLDSMLFEVMPQSEDSIYAGLSIDRLPLSIINILFPIDEVAGYIQSDVTLNGTMAKPDLSGNIKIVDGKALYKLYGIDYRNMQIGLNVADNKLNIDTFLIQSHDGNMKAGGNIQFQSEIYNAELNTSELKINFNRFNPVDHKYYNMEMSGNIDLAANRDSVLFSGNIDIPEAEIYLPALMNLMGSGSTAEIAKPLLLTELEKDSIRTDSVVYSIRPDSTGSFADRFEFLNNLQGNLKVKIPRNTWVKNDEMRLELSGDVELMKHRDYFELFGTIDVLRGQYSLLGKVFIIQSGTVTFQGGEEINPMLNIEALYSFRDAERNKRDLTLNVTGDLSSLELKFSFEGADISEGDALSYILFGTTMDALTSGQANVTGTGNNAASDVAQSVAASLISSQLTRLLGSTLNVDYIEFKSNSFENASFVVGKYITNKLFVSYEQQIGHIEDTDVARYEMTMEYEVFKFLFLQLTSSSLSNGVDVIFKFNSKK